MYNLKTTKILKYFAFTLAETLITLGIIGVVAALTIPGLIQSYQKQQTVVKLKKAYAILNQIARNSSNENGDAVTFLTTDTDVNENTTKEFFEKYWFSYLNAPAIDTKSNFQYKYINGTEWGVGVQTSYPQGRVLFTTMDGTSYFVLLMKWIKDENSENGQKGLYSSKQSIYVDLNGIKPPNTLGRDVFGFEIDFDNNNAVPMCSKSSKDDINKQCKTSGSCCSEKIKRDGWSITKDYPWK